MQDTMRRAVLLTQDLIFSTKVNGTARSMGFRVATAANVENAAQLCREEPVGCILIDLGASNLDIGRAVVELRSASDDAPIVAYGPHVDHVRLKEATLAGCRDVLPRSRFSAELPSILSRFLAVGPQDV